MNNDDLVNTVVRNSTFCRLAQAPKNVLDVMRRVDRRLFVPRLEQVPYGVSILLEYRDRVDPNTIVAEELPYHDIPLPIGYNQTCSQPSVVGIMADLLHLEEGMHILEVGAGCGYNAAILAELIGPSGHITSLERIAALADGARENLARHFGSGSERRVTVVHGDGMRGYVGNAPYDRIIFTAGIQHERFDNAALAEQCPEGIHLYPQHEGPLIREKYTSGRRQRQELLGQFGFVPVKQGVE